MKRWLIRDLIQEREIAYLHQALSDKPTIGKPICYVSTGFPLLDHVAAKLAFERAQQEGLGQSIHID